MNPGFEYLKRHVYTGFSKLTEQENAEQVYCFTETEFEIVLQRAQFLGLGITRIKLWSNNHLVNAICPNPGVEPNDPTWYLNAFWHSQTLGFTLTYTASFQIPYELIMGDLN
ncbi:MAG: hypothetical protein JWO32_2549 [Bacteroidetes bacterium]|nr:hypothetical protein [Bacteroidota bacterium]